MPPMNKVIPTSTFRVKNLNITFLRRQTNKRIVTGFLLSCDISSL